MDTDSRADYARSGLGLAGCRRYADDWLNDDLLNDDLLNLDWLNLDLLNLDASLGIDESGSARPQDFTQESARQFSAS